MGEWPERPWVNQCVNDHYVHKRCLQMQLASGWPTAHRCGECQQPVHAEVEIVLNPAVVAAVVAKREAAAAADFLGIGDLSYREYTKEMLQAQTSYIRSLVQARGSTPWSATVEAAEKRRTDYLLGFERALRTLLFGRGLINPPPSSGSSEQHSELNRLFDIQAAAEEELPGLVADIFFQFVNQGMGWLKRDPYLNERIVIRALEPWRLALPRGRFIWREWDTYPPSPSAQRPNVQPDDDMDDDMDDEEEENVRYPRLAAPGPDDGEDDGEDDDELYALVGP